MKSVFILISFTLLVLFLQTSAKEKKDALNASLNREVRSANAGKKEANAKKGKKKCKGKKCQDKAKRKERRKKDSAKETKKCRKQGKNCRKGNRGKGRMVKGGKTGRKKRGKKGKKGKGSKGKKGRKGKKKKDGKGKKKKDGEGKKKKNGKGKQGKRPKKNVFGKSERQTTAVPAACSADKCTDTDYVNLFNAYKKNDNMLRQLQRLVRFYDLLRRKANSALTTFQPAAEAIGIATTDCTTCRDLSLKPDAVSNCTLLQNCSVSAPDICSTNGITYEKVNSTCPEDGTCPAGADKTAQCGDGCPPPSPPGPPDCSDVCRVSDGDVPQLTEDDKIYAEETCLPLLKTWNKQYRDCNAGDTFSCQQNGCNALKGECNLKNCRCDTPERTCQFEECVDAKNTTGSDYKDFVCNTCLKQLDDKLEIPKRCGKIAKYERAVFARKEECIRKEKTGSFGDCVRSQRAIIPMIIPCLSTSTTTVAPGRRLSALKNQNMMFKMQNKKQFW